MSATRVHRHLGEGEVGGRHVLVVEPRIGQFVTREVLQDIPVVVILVAAPWAPIVVAVALLVLFTWTAIQELPPMLVITKFADKDLVQLL